MNLLLWRHAEAENGAPDLERALTENGHAQARRVGRWIRSQVQDDAQCVASPARRAQETAAALGLAVATDDRIAPDVPLGSVLAALGLPQAALQKKTLIVVGHQPWLGETAAFLMTGTPLPFSVRKAAVWWLSHRHRDGGTGWVLKTVVDPDHMS